MYLYDPICMCTSNIHPLLQPHPKQHSLVNFWTQPCKLSTSCTRKDGNSPQLRKICCTTPADRATYESILNQICSRYRVKQSWIGHACPEFHSNFWSDCLTRESGLQDFPLQYQLHHKRDQQVAGAVQPPTKWGLAAVDSSMQIHANSRNILLLICNHRCFIRLVGRIYLGSKFKWLYNKMATVAHEKGGVSTANALFHRSSGKEFHWRKGAT